MIKKTCSLVSIFILFFAFFFTPNASCTITTIKNKNEYNKMVNSGKPIIVKYYADWCGACTLIKKQFEELSEEVSHITFLAINIDKHQELAVEQNIKGIPTFVFIYQKEKKFETVGIENPKTFKDSVKKNIHRFFSDKPNGTWNKTKNYFDSFVDTLWSIGTSIVKKVRQLFKS